MPCQVDFERSTDHAKLWPSHRIAYTARSCELQEPTLSASFHPHTSLGCILIVMSPLHLHNRIQILREIRHIPIQGFFKFFGYSSKARSVATNRPTNPRVYSPANSA